MTRKRAREEDESVSSSRLANLPSHILMEIICRLPLKTLRAIRCVSKSLLKLVSGSCFAKLHSTKASPELFIGRSEPSLSSILYIAEPVFHHDSSIAVDMNFHVVFDLPRFTVTSKNDLNFKDTNKERYLDWVNTCNGLVCYVGGFSSCYAIICNPVTAEYATVPGPGTKDKTIESKYTSLGLGFSPKFSSFKLLRLLRKICDTMPVRADILAFGESGSWKTVANLPHENPRGNPTFYRGVLHWYVAESADMVTFDCDTEQFGKIVTPPQFFTGLTSCSVVGDCLYVTGSVGDCVEIWVMKEYGVLGSWIKAFSIREDAADTCYEPIQCLENKDILMLRLHRDLDCDESIGDIVCYNPDTASVKSIGSCSPSYRLISIRPSFVPLKVMLGDSVKARSVKSRNAFYNYFEVDTIPWWWTRAETTF